MTTIYLVRHGEIDANLDRRWHGWTDSELNRRGHMQAERMAAYLAELCPDICAVYSSPLKRTIATAGFLARRLGIETLPHDGLREFGIGQLEDQPFEALKEEHKFFDAIANDLDYAPPDGESVNQVCSRMLDALDEIRRIHRGRSLALVSHGAALAISLASLLDGAPMPYYQYHMDNTAITKLVWHDAPVMEFFNARHHLED